jgi:sigma-B regulation protein RsbU (phosphoserine phosphatase)
MRHSLYTRLIVWVGAPAILLFTVVVWSASRRSFNRVAAQTQESSRLMARYYAAGLEARLGAARKIPQMIALELETGALDTEKKVEAYLREVIVRNPEVYGSCIAFKPHGFEPARAAYAPYFYRADAGPKFEELGKPEYDYFHWPWYRLPRDAGHALWTEPYFDEGGGNTIMITYSAPFHRGGVFWGIATIDIAMTELMREMKRITVGRSGYAFIVSKQGRFLAFPDKSRIMRASIQDLNPGLARPMLAGQEGLLQTLDPLRGHKAWIAFEPVQEGDLSLAIVYPESEALAEARELRKELLVIGLTGLAGLFAALVFVARSISKPIAQLAAAAQRVAQGDLEHRLSVDAPTEEVGNLARAFNKMTRDLQIRMQELRYTTAVKERFEGELSAARNIQMSLAPKRFPAFPSRTEFDVHALLRPAREVGGDLYDFYFLDEARLCFLIGDVSGKGIPAALFMAVTKTLLKASSSSDRPMEQMMAAVNNELCGQTDSGMFVSLLLGRLDVRTGAVEICNAGHPSPYLLRAAGGVETVVCEHDVALGAMRGIDYHSSALRLHPGDTLFLYTDGVTEALDGNDAFYSTSRLESVLAHISDLPVEKITRGVVKDVRSFCGEREQSDDISVMAIRWRGPKETTP